MENNTIEVYGRSFQYRELMLTVYVNHGKDTMRVVYGPRKIKIMDKAVVDHIANSGMSIMEKLSFTIQHSIFCYMEYERLIKDVGDIDLSPEIGTSDYILTKPVEVANN